MKTRISLIAMIVLLCVILLTPAPSEAGTTFVGLKYWHAEWDSGVLDWFEQDLAVSFKQNRLQLSAHSEPGSGYLAGPMFGYLTDDGKWSLSVSPMIFSSFTQQWSGRAGPMELKGDVELSRMDIDIAASRLLSKRFKFFFGYKYQKSDVDFKLTYVTGMGVVTEKYKLRSEAHIPTVGIAAVQALTPKLVAGGQFGLLYAIMDLELKDSTGRTEDIRPYPGLGFNAEANLTYMPLERTIVQLGYRFQVFTLEARGPGRDDITKSYDITHGPSLTVMRTF